MSNETLISQNRLGWIDMAKGFVILWVVALHIGLLFDNNKFLNNLLFHSWAMPFFYMVSGLFLSHKDTFWPFVVKKTNQLIVPLVFFVFMTNVLFWVAGDLLGGAESGWIQSKFKWVSTLQFCWYEGSPDFRNFPLWFIPALFNASLIYKFIIIAAKDQWLPKILLTFTLVGVMFIMGQYEINLPLFIDVGILALPYLLMGDFLKNRTDFVSNEPSRLSGLLWGIVVFAMFLVGYIVQANYQLFPFIDILRYVTAISGSLFVLWCAKRIPYSRFLSFCGRNSLIILGVHLPLTAIRPVLMHFIHNEWIMKGVLFVAIVTIACGLSFLFDKYIPKLVGKKALLDL